MRLWLSKEKIDPTYKRLRWQVFIGIFIGYAGYYLVRKNFSLAMPYLVDMGFDKGLLGVAISANAISLRFKLFLRKTYHFRYYNVFGAHYFEMK